jgi:hypothetical protein
VERHAEFAPPAYGQPGCIEQLSCAYQFHPVRRCGSTEQRLWLGPSGYPRGGGRQFANTHTLGNTHTYGDSVSITLTNTYGYGYGYGYGDSDSDTYAYAYAQGKTKASADSASAALRIG